MEVAVEVEDDVFFADLSKQINLLIMDDDDEDLAIHSPAVSFQAFSQAIQLQPAPQLPYLHEQNCRRESKGTGVFIPRSSHQRRKNKQGRNNFSGAKLQKHYENSRGLPQVPYNHNNEAISYNNSFNLRRF